MCESGLNYVERDIWSQLVETAEIPFVQQTTAVIMVNKNTSFISIYQAVVSGTW